PFHAVQTPLDERAAKLPQPRRRHREQRIEARDVLEIERADVVLPLLHHAPGALVAKAVVAEQIGIVTEVAAIRAAAYAFVVDHAVALAAVRLRQRPIRRWQEIEIGGRRHAAVDNLRRPALDDSTTGRRLN